MFHYTVETSKTMDEAIRSLEENLKDIEFGVQWQFSVKATLESKGFELENPFTILEVCNPKEAQNMLSTNQLIGYFLPCKLVVYQDNQGQTKIGMPRPTVLVQMVEDESVNKVASDVEKRLISCIDKSI